MLKQSRNALTHLAKRYRAVLRRCRLRALALACACALTALPPLPAGAENTGGTETSISGTPAYVGSLTGSDGHVIIDSGFVGRVYGGYTTAAGTDATGNTVRLTNGTVTGVVYGGWSYFNSMKNTVIISGGAVTGVVYGGHADYATNNTVIISGTASVGIVYGGGTLNANATHNTVILSGAPTLNGIINGGGGFGAGKGDRLSGNLLEVRSSGLTAPNIHNFAAYAFVLPVGIRPGDVLLTLNDSTDLTNGGASPSPDIQRIDVAGDASPLRVGDTVTLLKSNGTLDPGNLPSSVSGTQGVSLTYTFALAAVDNAVVARVMGYEDTETGDEGPRLNPQTKALSEGYVSGTALALQGADLAAGKGLDAAGQAVRASRAENGKGVTAFGALSGGWSRYNTGSHIDVSGFSLLTGLAWGADSVHGQFTAGMFFEYGSASTGTYNSFSNAASVTGDGSTWYMGAGLLARMDFTDSGPGHFYAEASGRAGVLNNTYRNDDLRDADGRRAEFDTSTPYISLHVGLGYIWNLTDALSLDLHASTSGHGRTAQTLAFPPAKACISMP